MRVFITGCAGMLGSAVYPAFVRAGHEVAATDLVPRTEPDLPMAGLDVRDADAVARSIAAFDPDLVVHLAAETDLERCETDRDHAYATNALGTLNVARATAALDRPLVYISTAGVFGGDKAEQYTELDDPDPINVYGASKYEGELIVARTVPRHFIVRPGWMIGGGGRDHKFVAKIVAQIHAGETCIYAVTDKVGTPTYTEDFAANLVALVATRHYGVYHMTCLGTCSRLDVAREIVAYFGRLDIKVVGVESVHFSGTYFAPRPRSEALHNRALELIGLNLMRDWRDALNSYLDQTDWWR